VEQVLSADAAGPLHEPPDNRREQQQAENDDRHGCLTGRGGNSRRSCRTRRPVGTLASVRRRAGSSATGRSQQAWSSVITSILWGSTGTSRCASSATHQRGSTEWCSVMVPVPYGVVTR